MCLSIANNFIGLGGRAYPVRHYPIAIRLRDRKGRAILCVALISSEWGLFGCNTRSAIRGTSSPRSYCHPTQPILQLRSHYFVENTASPSLKSHPPAHLRASSQWARVWLYDRWNLSFSTKYARLLAYVRFFLYLCRVYWHMHDYDGEFSSTRTIPQTAERTLP